MPNPLKLFINTVIGFFAVVIPAGVFAGVLLLLRYYVFNWHRSDVSTNWVASSFSVVGIPLILWGLYCLGDDLRYRYAHR